MSLLAATVSVVDDDPAVRKALTRLLGTAGLGVRAYPSAQAFLEEHDGAHPGCLVLDVALPGLNGLELQRALATSGRDLAIVFITGQSDVPVSVEAMKHGAVDFLMKPFDEAELLGAVRAALEQDAQRRRRRADLESIEERLAKLTPREREVLEQVVRGRLNKQIAADLGTVEKTIKVHRARVMAKLGVRSLADLVRLAVRAGIGHGPPNGRSVATP